MSLHYQKYKETSKRSSAKWVKDHPEEILAGRKAYYQNNTAYREKKKASMRAYGKRKRADAKRIKLAWLRANDPPIAEGEDISDLVE
jgi:hypothetical protein